MPTEHCSLCEEGKSCGNHHVYVIEFRKEFASKYAKGPYKGYLYVGYTGKSVEERFDDTFRLKDGTKLSIEEGRKRSDEKVWKYNTGNMRRIRRHYLANAKVFGVATYVHTPNVQLLVAPEAILFVF